MKYLLTFTAAALIALCIVGLASAQALPAAPTGVTVLSSGEGFVVSWTPNDAVAHRIAYMNRGEYESARDAADGDWTTALNYIDVPSGDTGVIPAEDLIAGDDYWIILGSVDRQNPAAVSWGGWILETAIHGMGADDALTRSYVMDAIAYYDANGREAAIAHYSDPASQEAERYLLLIDPETTVILASPIPLTPGLKLSDLGEGVLILRDVDRATEQGHWFEQLSINFATGRQEPARFFIVIHDGLAFTSSHFIVRENVADATQNYVNRAIEYYDDNGRDATIAYYNSRASMDGQFYLFMMDENDIYLVHPISPNLRGTDIKLVTGSDGQELGKEIAQATAEGIWVEYLWLNPITFKEETKVTWAIRHDGKIFASGYYTGREDPATPPWATADPREYTEQYVDAAIERYRRYGLEATKAYYNSVASFEGEFYLFATDPDDTYIIHPLLPHLIGTDLKDVERDGFELGKELAKATNEQGVWVEYQWPHPITLADADKVGYAKRYDGYLFASGYYPLPDDPEAYTQNYVREAIDLYDSEGLDALADHYNDRESIADGHWFLIVIDRDNTIRVHGLVNHYIGVNAAEFNVLGNNEGEEMLKATEEGRWFQYVYANTRGAGNLVSNNWSIKYDGLIFVSGYHTPYVAPEPTDDALTRAYVEAAIARYDRDGRESAFAYYNSRESLEGARSLFVFDPATYTMWVTLIRPEVIGIPLANAGDITAFLNDWIAATETGAGWLEYQSVNPLTGQSEPKRAYGIVHDGLIFTTGHFILQENIGDTTKNYVNKAIAYYEENGLEATIARYNSRDSLDGFFYLFLMDENDIYLAHPIREDLRGTDIKDLPNQDLAGNPLGIEIAKATEAGIWVEYLWPNPVSGRVEAKTTWAIRYQGLIFASGYYTPDPDAERPAWLDADPKEYTVDYVNRAIKRYEEDGLDAMVDYYDSVASYEGEWYLFATNADDIYIVHPLVPRLKGTDIKGVVDKDGYELGKALAAAGEGQGVWVEYLWPHPATGRDAKKVAYAVRKDGMIFASGYYPAPDDLPAFAQAFAQGAVAVYDSDGLDGVIKLYGKGENSEGLWFLQVLDEDGIYLVNGITPRVVGIDANLLGLVDLDGNPYIPQVLKATEDGRWISAPWPLVNGPENLKAHSWVVQHDGLFFLTAYFDTLSSVPTSEPTDTELTRAYVEQAIAYYDANGREATLAYYNTPESIAGERGMLILDGDDHTILAWATNPHGVGNNTFTAPGTPLGSTYALATPEGYWSEVIGQDRATGQEVARLRLAVRHDGLIFASSHIITREDRADFTQDYVNRAIDFYDREGLDATVAYYDSRESVDGQFYLFLIGADDIYLAHPIFPYLKDTDIKDVKDTTGYELGKEIAKATAAGHWVDYLWPNPVTGVAEPKSAWVVRHDGLIFASGYYTPDPNAEPPAWQGADTEEYTVTYVKNAIARYQRDGLESMKAYYSSVASFEGEWYLFVVDANANDTYIVHPLFRHLVGADIKNVTSPDNPNLGRQIAAATAEGTWVDYLWPHPLTAQEVPKRAYAERYDGLIFASGYHPPQVEDPRARTRAYVDEAIEYYRQNGRDATVARYNDPASADGVWYLVLLDEDFKILAHILLGNLLGVDARLILPTFAVDFPVDELPRITEEGQWIQYTIVNPNTAETDVTHMWAVKHDGLLFASAYVGSE